ncbi:winged helix-turn-helix domain-containing protein [Erwinia sp. MMLR14_017]|uniref:winged helix-turn-helix domain-containing protein n=1 Tax=Erwinia sp. MMLR14_017 TaxID=3093842 RepID=UPI00298F9B67|nr:winged helix-turn-helix domain-containing protein [Erwinia sp. MMLR14_017]MDW8847663.1 winged helix-turn-helix domain-containing protein [Erwinia sp. MMLR14_017]
MIYIIDGTIAYNSEDCSLSHLPTQESLSLSISSGRLFERLLNSAGEILPRDTLLTEVWDKYGLRGSNSNLNQYLSILRRALAAYGCENLIITIPKVGIRLNTEIPVEREPGPTELIPEATPVIASNQQNDSPISVPTETKRPERGWPGTWLLLSLLMALLSVSAGWYYLKLNASEQEISPVSATLPGGCSVVFLEGLNVSESQKLDKQILQMLSENHQTCDSSRRLYFDKNTAFSSQNYGRTTLSSCKLNDRGQVISCDNFYYLDWRLD